MYIVDELLEYAATDRELQSDDKWPHYHGIIMVLLAIVL